MSRTLFWYILKDLLRIFFMTSGVLAGIMSFGGLLRPLTEHGLNAAQVGEILTYFMPAMMTFSLPVAALFATTMVYGRLSADNELTACRASGISYLSLTVPALVLGLALAIVSLLCLCFVVPHYNLKVEKVVVSNLAEVVQTKIQQSHQIRLPHPNPKKKEMTIFAQSARIEQPDATRPGDQVVTLINPMFVEYEPNTPRDVRIPRQFFIASEATAYIHQTPDRVEFTATLKDGATFPRDMRTGKRVSVGGLAIPLYTLDAAVREDPKFMNIQQLKDLRMNPANSREIRSRVRQYVEQEQEAEFLRRIRDALNATRQFVIDDGQEQHVLRRGDPPAAIDGTELLVPSAGADLRQARLEHYLAGSRVSSDDAREVGVEVVRADNERRLMHLEVRLNDVQLGAGEARASHTSFPRYYAVPMPADLAAYWTEHTADYYETAGVLPRDDQGDFIKALGKLRNQIQSELHSRAAFGISCLILVIVGCALGMMFKSGNFLSAFAVSVMPALLCVALIVTGQHVGEASHEAIALALSIIWSGNIAVLILAASLLWRLQRQ